MSLVNAYFNPKNIEFNVFKFIVQGESAIDEIKDSYIKFLIKLITYVCKNSRHQHCNR